MRMSAPHVRPHCSSCLHARMTAMPDFQRSIARLNSVVSY